MTSRPLFYICTPNFTPLSGGPIALHTLCHYLNEIGFEAYVTAAEVSGKLRTPTLTGKTRDAHLRAGRKAVAVYPEATLGNPLNCEYVIRYMLNRAGARSSHAQDELNEFWTAPERKSEFFLHYADEFKDPDVPSTELWMPIIDRDIYKPSSDVVERRGFLLYSHRVKYTDAAIPAWASDHIKIEMKSPRSPSELAELYRTSAGLVTFERTGAMHEALLCGCPVVCVPNPRFKELPMFQLFGSAGVGWGNSEAQLQRANATVQVFNNIYEAYIQTVKQRLKSVITDMLDFFD